MGGMVVRRGMAVAGALTALSCSTGSNSTVPSRVDDVVRIDWDLKPSSLIPSESELMGGAHAAGHAHFREKQLVRPSKRSNMLAVLVANFGMLLPYLIGICLIGLVFLIIALARRQRSQSRRISV